MGAINGGLRLGVVTQVYEEEAAVRVQYLDLDGVVSGKLKVLQKNTKDNKDYWLPDLEELVVVASFPGALHNGAVLGSLYNSTNEPPFTEKEVRGLEFADGTRLFYNREESLLRVEAAGDVEIEAAGNITVIGESDLTVEAGGDVTVTANSVTIGGEAAEPLVLGNKLKSLYNSMINLIKNHVHPDKGATSSSLSALQDMGSSHLSSLSSTE